MLHVSFDGLTFVDVSGKYRKIYGCALKQRKELHHALTELHKRLAASKIRTIADLYDGDPEFGAIADECLQLCKIDPNWLSVDMLTEFLLPHRKDNQPVRPLLEQLNFPPVERTGEVSTEWDVLAALWAQTQDLEQALRLAGYEEGSPPWNELAEIMKASYARSPEGREQQDFEDLAEDFAAAQARLDPPVGGDAAGERTCAQRLALSEVEVSRSSQTDVPSATQIATPQQADELFRSMLSA
jgi:hypothetical protein